MLTKLNIEDFKGIQSLQFESLERINLLAGANDVGKTSAMEALFFLFVNDQQSLSNFPTVFRNGKGEGASLSPEDQFVHFWSWLVYQGAPIAKIVAVNPTFEAMTMSYGRNLTTSSAYPLRSS